ncbi:Inner membrane ABC transporter permease protein YnjC [Paraglaciecola mesophila]|uniref:Inner membrane ABC transporter permease protein YnjC n=1 Tax=Paraglaciecola mesophila TaxID=197222 RepID=A0A857JJ51_9ALTE|nr:ABC transporter permease subunit [Paraglaciecola mesophila]QHJ11963.1 Inner membrane ABC transporter permease protein YnjC [Paraglaciecola mesophila]
MNNRLLAKSQLSPSKHLFNALNLGFRSTAWVLVAIIALAPLFGVVIGLWPTAELDSTAISHFLTYNGLAYSVLSTLLLSLVAPLIALYIAFMVYSQYRFNQRWQSLEKRLAPLLSLPHLAVALGLVYLFSSGGMLWSALWGLIGQTAPEWLGLPRKSMLTMILAISIKEVPFFLLIFSAIGRQLAIKQWLLQGRALGYSESASWWLIVFPVVLKQSRLAVLAAMAYTLSVLDISLLVGPNIPELYAVVLYNWQTGFTPDEQAFAFLGNLLLIAMLGVLIACIYIHEQWVTNRLAILAVMANPLNIARVSQIFTAWLGFFSLLTLAILATFLLWSLGWNTQSAFTAPDWSTTLWQDEWFFMQGPLLNSLHIAFLSSILGVGVTLLALELQRYNKRYLPDYLWLLAILLPQLSMVYGWQILHTSSNASYHSSWIILSHVPFTFAYSYLVLRGPFQSINRHYELVAASFGYSPWQRWWNVRFMLLRPALLSAFAIAFSVSIAQYIPTLMIGAGRVSTITTEAVAIASGNEQNITAVYILVQAALPFIIFLVASILAQRTRGSVDAEHQ